MASRTVRKLKQGKKKSKESCCAPAPFIVVTPPSREGATTVGNYCSSSSSTSYEGVHFHGTCSAARPTPASPSSKQLNSAFFQNEVVTSGVVRSQLFHSVGEVHSPQLAALRASGGVAAGPYKPVPPPRPLGASPAVRGPGAPYIPPPAPSPGLPGAAPQPLHTHSSKFPIEREVVVSNCDKSAKIPVVQQYRRAVAVAPDAPPRLQAAWTLPQNMQNQQSATSPDGFRQAGPSRNCIPQEPNNAVSPPVPLKQTFIYGTRADCKYDDTPNGQSQSVSANDSTKEGNKESKSTSKAMTKTYHTLKDMISSRFKGKDSNESESKSNDAEAGLNNVTEELRKSMRERAEQEANNAAINAAREISRKTAGEQGIYGRPVPQQRGIASDLQYSRHLVQMHPLQNNAVQGQYQGQIQPVQQPGNQTPNQLLTQQQYLQQQLMLNQQQQHILGHGPSASSTPQHGLVQARSQELINRQNMLTDGIQRPHSQMMQQLTTADSIYYQPQYNQQRNVNRNVNYQSEIQQNSNYPALKQTPSNQMDTADSRSADLRSPQQLEREILRQRGLIEGHRTASQPQLPMDDDQNDLRFDQMDPSTPIATNKVIPMRRGSHGNLIETLTRTPIAGMEHEKDSDDGGFRTRLNAQGRSFDSKDRPGTSAMSYNNRQLDVNSKVNKTEINGDKNDNIYSGMKQPIFNGLPQAAQRQIDISEDVGSSNVKKVNPGSTASSDYDKNGGPSSNVDSGRGSAAYSSGRRVGHDTSTESDPLPGSTNGRPNVVNADHNTTNSKHFHDKNGIGGDSEWVDIVESELRQILEPKLHGLSLNGNNNGQGVGNGVTGSETVSSVTPPLPPLSPAPSSPEATPRNSARFKHQSLPYGSKPEYGSENRTVMPNQRAGWQHTSKHRSGGSKKQEHSSQYKKHMFGLDTTDITSTTTRSLDLSSMLDGQSDSDVSTQDARAIRRQLQGLENMYCEVLKLLGVRKPTNHGLGKYQPSDPRLAKRRYGSVSSLPSSSVSSRPVRDKRRNATEQRKKVNDIKGINKRFQRLESHVVTLARSVAHLSSEMRTQHLMIQEMENIRGEITALRNQQRSQSMPRMDTNFCTINGYGGVDASSLANPSRVKKLTKFFGDEPPLLRMFLKKLGYEKYASLLENERVGAAELPFLGEERLRALGVPLGPRLRILHEARLALPPANTPHTTLCIV